MKSLLFSKLAEVYEELEKTSSGNKLREILSKFFKKIPKKEIDKVAYLNLGSIASKYEKINLNMAESMVLKSIAKSCNKDLSQVKRIFKQKGDIGITAEFFESERKKKLTVKQVFDGLHKIAKSSGKGSQEQKTKILADLLAHSSPKEARYLARIVLGTLRLGVADMTVLDSLSIAFTGTKDNKKRLEHAYNICPDVGVIASTLLKKGLKGIDRIGVLVGRPIQMMLCQRVKTMSMIKDKIPGKITAEEKYDGERVQVHKIGDKITLFSRRLDDITDQFPDVVSQIRRNINARRCVVEGEIMAVDKKGNLLPFQRLMRRRRKYDIDRFAKEVPVCLYLFDLLYLKDRSFIHKKYPDRFKELKRIVKKTRNLKIANQIITDDLDKIEDFFNSIIERGGEGIIAKSHGPDSVYKAGTRGWNWIKWKKEYAKDMGDTFDLAVVGAFAGKGRRAGTYGALLCASYNKKQDRFDTVCKLGSGFTDSVLAELPKKLKKYLVKKKNPRVNVHRIMKPDFWFEPRLVVEVLGSEITRSPIHTCSVKDGKGLALRFPRFVRYRKDKSAEQATTDKELLRMFINR